MYSAMFAVLAILVIFFGLLSRHFLTLRTLQSVLNQVPDLMVIATGMTLVLIAGGIDLSVGSVLALSGVILGMAMADWGWPLLPAIALCLAVGAACGLANGVVSARLVDPFVHRHAGNARSRARDRLSRHQFSDQVHRATHRGRCATARKTGRFTGIS